MTSSMAWGGFQNGRIPTSAMVLFEGTGKYLQADAGASLTRLFDATEKATGARPYIAPDQDLNRNLAEQIRLLEHNYRVVASGGSIVYGGKRWAKRSGIDPTTGRAYVTCATPGTSNHGWARAADISFPTAASRAWFRAHCGEYDWYNSGDAFGEDWHKEFHGPITTTAGSGTKIGDFLMALSDTEQAEIHEWLRQLAYGGIQNGVRDLAAGKILFPGATYNAFTALANQNAAIAEQNKQILAALQRLAAK